MVNDMNPRHERGDNSPDEGRDIVEAMRASIDAAAAGGGPDHLDDQTEALVARVLSSPAVRGASLSQAALAILGALLPDTAIADESLRQLYINQLRAFEMAQIIQEAELTCTAPSPGELLRTLRIQEGLPLNRAADALGIAPTLLLDIEAMKRPWYTIDPQVLPAFAPLVGTSPKKLVACLKVAARRSIVAGVQKRAGNALGRFDTTQEQNAARSDTLRLAFARMSDENTGAASFFARTNELLNNGDLDALPE